MRKEDLRLGIVQMNSEEDRDANLAKAETLLAKAVQDEGADMVILPEFFNIPYVFQWRDYAHIDRAEPADGPSIRLLRDLAKRHGVAIITAIFELESAGLCYDTAFFIDRDGEVVGKYRKTHPAAVNSLEKIYFRFGSHYPVVSLLGWRVGAVICYDTFFPEAARCVALKGAELIAIPFAAPPVDAWRAMMMTRAFENGVWLAPANKTGREGDWTFGGESMIVDPRGQVRAEAGRDNEGVIAADISRDAVFAARREKPMFRDRRPDLYGAITTPTEDLLGQP